MTGLSARSFKVADSAAKGEQIVIADEDRALLDENRLKGTTIPPLD